MKIFRLIVIHVLPEPSASAFAQVREEASRISGSRAALAYPPHITLRTGALVPEDALGSYMEGFGELIDGESGFVLQTDGFDYRMSQESDRERYLVSYTLRPSLSLLQLHRKLGLYTRYRKGPQGEFHPHLTLAFDDLSEAGFLTLQRTLVAQEPPFNRTFEWTCDNVCLYAQSGEQWTELQRYVLLPRG